MTPSTTAYASRINHNALLPRLVKLCMQQWQAWQDARRQTRADELTWKMALQDARMMADLSRAMNHTATNR